MSKGGRRSLGWLVGFEEVERAIPFLEMLLTWWWVFAANWWNLGLFKSYCVHKLRREELSVSEQ